MFSQYQPPGPTEQQAKLIEKLDGTQDGGQFDLNSFNEELFQFLISSKRYSTAINFLKKVDIKNLSYKILDSIVSSQNNELLISLLSHKDAWSIIHTWGAQQKDASNNIQDRIRVQYLELLSSFPIPQELNAQAEALYNRMKGFSKQYENEIVSEEFAQKRMEASGTLHVIKGRSVAKDNFKACWEWIEKKAEVPGLVINIKFLEEINTRICEDKKGLRYEKVKSSDGTYLDPKLLRIATDRFQIWIAQELSACDRGERNPIIVASLAYQRLTSLHLFVDGNGRTARMLMDCILARYNLPPACFSENDRVAIFPFTEPKERNATVVVTAMLEAMKKSDVALTQPKPKEKERCHIM